MKVVILDRSLQWGLSIPKEHQEKYAVDIHPTLWFRYIHAKEAWDRIQSEIREISYARAKTINEFPLSTDTVYVNANDPKIQLQYTGLDELKNGSDLGLD